MAKLGEFRTHKQLDVWPEIESYAKQAFGLNVAKVPSVNVHSLNEKIGLAEVIFNLKPFHVKRGTKGML